MSCFERSWDARLGQTHSMLRVIANDLSPNPRPASVGASSLGAVPIAVAAVENKGETDDTQVRQW